MTLTQQERSHLAKFIVGLRRDWHDDTVETSLVALSQQITDPFEVAAIAIAWARRPDARTPAGMNHPELRTNDPTASIGWRTRPGPECPEHHNPNWRTSDGMWACCWTEQFTDASDPTSPSMAPGEPQ